MGYDKLIERLKHHANAYRNGKTLGRVYVDEELMLDDAVTAICELRVELQRAATERDVLISRLRGKCWACSRRYDCDSRRGPHSKCWTFYPQILLEAVP